MQNENLALINMGANAGNIVFQRLSDVGMSLQSKLQQGFVISDTSNWNGASLNVLAQGLSIGIAYKFKKAAPTLSAAVVGSQMFTDAIDELIDPIVSKLPDKARLTGKALIQSGLIYYGCFSQLLPTSRSVPAPLAPLVGFESSLSKAILK